jgi:membrane-associated protein
MTDLSAITDVFLHTGAYLDTLSAEFGVWLYVILFLIIFVETGLVVMPFLPGDSLIFAAGALAGTGRLELEVLAVIFLVAAIAGDTLNYTVGRFAGEKIVTKYPRLIPPKHLTRASEFFENHGGKAVVLARFVPVVRTVVPFVAGAGSMRYPLFMRYNILGALIWVASALLAGYFLGAIPFVQENFSIVIIAVIFVSLLPPIIGYWSAKKPTVDRQPSE